MLIKKLPSEFRPVEERAYIDWVEKGCKGSLKSVHRYVPQVFESYVHICHPAWKFPASVNQPRFKNASQLERSRQMIPTHWSEAVKEKFPRFDGLHSWSEIGTDIDYTNPSPGDISAPLEGIPQLEAINTVEKAIAIVTGREQECTFAIWHGFQDKCLGQQHLSRTKIERMAQQEHWLLRAPRVILFDYWRSVLESPCYWHPNRTPQAVWSPEKLWFYAVPYHTHSSIFGGSKEMAKILLESKDLEAYELPEGHAFKY